MTRIVPMMLAIAVALAADGLPSRAGEVAIETLKIQNEGIGKAGHDGRYILTAPRHGPSSGKAKQAQDEKAGAAGDPDRPIIVGPLWNLNSKSPAAGKSGATTAHELSHTVQQRGGGSPALPQPDDEAIVGFEHGQSKGGALKAR